MQTPGPSPLAAAGGSAPQACLSAVVLRGPVVGSPRTQRGNRRVGRALCLAAILLHAGPGLAGDDELDVDVSYIYAAVLGSGTYKINGRRITMFRLPFGSSGPKPFGEVPDWQWLLPVVIGYDDLSNVDSDLIEALLPDRLVTLSALPGVEYRYPVSPRWVLKPFAQAGAGRDFTSNETIWMTRLGVRSLSLFDLDGAWRLQWGNAFSWAAEYQRNSGDRVRLSMLETGLDLRHDLPGALLGRPADVGVYYVYQKLIPQWRTSEAGDRRVETQDLNEIGISLGVRQPRRILGFDVQRVRVGYKAGGPFTGWTIGTEFPF